MDTIQLIKNDNNFFLVRNCTMNNTQTRYYYTVGIG